MAILRTARICCSFARDVSKLILRGLNCNHLLLQLVVLEDERNGKSSPKNRPSTGASLGQLLAEITYKGYEKTAPMGSFVF